MEGTKSFGTSQFESSMGDVSSELADSLRDVKEQATQAVQGLPPQQKSKFIKRMLKEIDVKVSSASASLTEINTGVTANAAIAKKIARNGKIAIFMLGVVMLLLIVILLSLALG